ncbi:hypothetical protein [Streptomyces sp. cg2]|uniref:hypothetical protein n=1 Tax=Streptomyces sp. cg2 TaxID=3238799 RepID=UPI0034E194BA
MHMALKGKPSTSTGQPPTPDAREVPELNGCWLDRRFTAGAEARLGVAVSPRGGGLVVPLYGTPTRSNSHISWPS